MVADKDDWRRMGQGATLAPGTAFLWQPHRTARPDWDHDHCSMCSAKFMDPTSSGDAAEYLAAHPEVLTEGYVTIPESARGEGQEWVCAECFADFRDEFGWNAP